MDPRPALPVAPHELAPGRHLLDLQAQAAAGLALRHRLRFACGAAVSFTPLIGFHFVLAAVLAWVLRGNIIASAIGTAVGNPWTFPFIWFGIIWLGTTILGYERGQELPEELTVGTIFEQPETVLLPMLVGGLPTALVVWILFFLPIRRVVANYQHHRQARRLRRRRVLAEERRVRLDRAAGEDDEDLTIPRPAPRLPSRSRRT